jgi:hypothetical protein
MKSVPRLDQSLAVAIPRRHYTGWSAIVVGMSKA